MKADLTPIFRLYGQLRDQADALFQKVSSQFPDCVKCRPGCDDCCHALFDLSLVEAMHVNMVFNKTFGHGPERSRLLENASRIDRDLTKLKRKMYQAEKDGAKSEEILDKAAALRMPCPLLGSDHRCVLYDARPITCRLYGIPLDIGGKSHVCGLSGFQKGRDYPAVQMRRIQEKLEQLSASIAREAESPFEFNDVYVPLSMVLLTRYDDAYFGIGKNGAED